MSLVSLVATSHFISFMSDGRVVDEAGTINESYKKITKVNSQVIFSVTGSYHASKIINESVDQYNTKNAQLFARDLFESLGKDKINRPVQILIGGLDQSGNIYYTGFDESSKELIEFHPILHEIRHGFTGGDEESDPNQLLSSLIQRKVTSNSELSLEKVQQAQNLFNEAISKKDTSVNNNVFVEHIIK